MATARRSASQSHGDKQIRVVTMGPKSQESNTVSSTSAQNPIRASKADELHHAATS